MSVCGVMLFIGWCGVVCGVSESLFCGGGFFPGGWCSCGGCVGCCCGCVVWCDCLGACVLCLSGCIRCAGRLAAGAYLGGGLSADGSAGYFCLCSHERHYGSSWLGWLCVCVGVFLCGDGVVCVVVCCSEYVLWLVAWV